jgi:hypothetical protein
LIRTPGAASVSVAVPMLWPEAFLMSTTTDFGAASATAIHVPAMLQKATAENAKIDEILMFFPFPKLTFQLFAITPIF